MTILPGSVLGMLGGGQLGRMFTSEARRMGYGVIVVDPDPTAPAGHFASRHLALPWDDPSIPARLAESCAAVSTEWENVPAGLLEAVAERLPVRPSAAAVATTQDRAREKGFLAAAGIPTVRWAEIAPGGDVESAWQAIGAGSGILKTARLGYDGKGQATVHAAAEVTASLHRFGTRCVLEERVVLACEVSVMVARGGDGQVVTWPVGENVHRNGILHTTVVPAGIARELAEEARLLAERIVMALDYVGVMGVEYFVTEDGRLLVNELAPRPHNSGHWTLDAAVTSQFEQQVRILTDMPLGETSALSPVAMVNLLGDLWPDIGELPWEQALAIPGVRLHLYGKQAARPGRKMGHLTATAPEASLALDRVTRAWKALTG